MRLLVVLVVSLAPGLFARDLPWTVLSSQDSGVSRNGLAVLSARGAIYSTRSEPDCPSPALTFGESSGAASCVTAVSASGRQIFSVQIGGAIGLIGLFIDAAGNAYTAGTSFFNGQGFAASPGAYETSPVGGNSQFVCKLSGADGHPLFCTFVDVTLVTPIGNSPGFAIDSAGNTYLAGACTANLYGLCIEKLTPTGSGIGYLVEIRRRPVSRKPRWSLRRFVRRFGKHDL